MCSAVCSGVIRCVWFVLVVCVGVACCECLCVAVCYDVVVGCLLCVRFAVAVGDGRWFVQVEVLYGGWCMMPCVARCVMVLLCASWLLWIVSC